MTGVYMIENVVNGNVYVGSAVNLTDRWWQHRSDLSKGVHRNDHLQKAWNKYGAAAFLFKEILYCAKEYLITWEQIAIDGLKAVIGWSRMYNISPTAGSRLGAKVSGESRERIRAAQTGKKLSAEHKEKIRSAHLKYFQSTASKWMIGKVHSAETRAKMSAAQKGRKKSPEHIAKVVAANRGRTATAEARANMSAAHRGKTISPEHRRKLGMSVRRFYELKREQAGPSTATVSDVIKKEEASQ